MIHKAINAFVRQEYKKTVSEQEYLNLRDTALLIFNKPEYFI